MAMTIPDEVLHASRMSEAEIKVELAVLLYERDKLALGQAATLAGMGQLPFQHLLSSRGITVHYDVVEFQEDLRTLRALGALT